MRRMDIETRRVNEALLEDAVFEVTNDAVLDYSEAHDGVRVTLASGEVVDTEIYTTIFTNGMPDWVSAYPLNGLNQPTDFETNNLLLNDEQLIAFARSALLKQTPALTSRR